MRQFFLSLGVLAAGCAGGEARPQVRMPLVEFENVTLDDQGAIVRWFVLDATVYGPDGALAGPSPVTRFSLEREDLVSGRRVLLADALPSTARAHEDHGLLAGGRYRYLLTFQVAEGANTTVASTPFDGPKAWMLQFTNPMRSSDKGAVFVRIRKFENGVGLVDTSHIHFEGDRIGWWKEGTPAVVSHHRVTRPGGKSVSVDFDTGATLVAVRAVRKVVEARRCKPIFALNGMKLGCERIVEKRNFECYEVFYRDSEGDHQVNVPEPRSLDQLCDDHKSNPDAPKAEPRLFEVQVLLDEADRLWNVDSAASIKIYQRLLRDYKDAVIRLQVRNKVEGRARQADD
jgi:hypothetical protein